MLIVMMQWKCVQSGSCRRNASKLVTKLGTSSLANVEPVTGSTLARGLVPSFMTGHTLARDKVPSLVIGSKLDVHVLGPLQIKL